MDTPLPAVAVAQKPVPRSGQCRQSQKIIEAVASEVDQLKSPAGDADKLRREEAAPWLLVSAQKRKPEPGNQQQVSRQMLVWIVLTQRWPAHCDHCASSSERKASVAVAGSERTPATRQATTAGPSAEDARQVPVQSARGPQLSLPASSSAPSAGNGEVRPVSEASEQRTRPAAQDRGTLFHLSLLRQRPSSSAVGALRPRPALRRWP